MKADLRKLYSNSEAVEGDANTVLARPPKSSKPAPAAFSWDDPFLLDDQLTEDERLIRDTRVPMRRTSCLRGRSPKPISRKRPTPRSSTRWAEIGLIGCHAAEDMLRQYELRRLLAWCARDRAGRFRTARELVQSSLVMVSDLCLWRREPAQEIPAQARHRRMGRLLRSDEPDAGSDPDGMKTRAEKVSDRIPADRQQDVDIELADRATSSVWAKSAEHNNQIAASSSKGMKGLSAPNIGGKLSLRAPLQERSSWIMWSCRKARCCPTFPA